MSATAARDGFDDGERRCRDLWPQDPATPPTPSMTCWSVPADLDPILGIFVAQMGPIAANGILHADAEIFGTHVRRLGEGVAGRPVSCSAAAPSGCDRALRPPPGAEVVVAEPSAWRRGKAEALGLDRHDRGRRPGSTPRRAGMTARRTAARTSSSRPARGRESLHDGAAGAAAAGHGHRPRLLPGRRGRDLRLGEEFHHNGLTIRCAQIGRVPRGLAHCWDRRRLVSRDPRPSERRWRSHPRAHDHPYRAVR